MLYHPHLDLFVASGVGFLVFSIVYYLDTNNRTIVMKMRNIQEFTTVERNINILVWALIYMMFRGVDSVS